MDSCTICMKEDLNNNNIYTTDCNHIFCKDCLDDWFQRGNNSCPLCRSEINTYSYKDEKYKLIIHKIENNIQTNQISLTELINNNINVRNIIRKNIRLRFYGFSISLLFLYYLNQYLFISSKNNELSSELDDCILNSTDLKNNLNQYELLLSSDNYIGRGYYISMYNGEMSRNCFYPLKFYNICFNK